MEPFNPTAICPKCLHPDVRTIYSTGSSWASGGCSYNCPEKGHRREHLERSCDRCHYQWPQACAEQPSTRPDAAREVESE